MWRLHQYCLSLAGGVSDFEHDQLMVWTVCSACGFPCVFASVGLPSLWTAWVSTCVVRGGDRGVVHSGPTSRLSSRVLIYRVFLSELIYILLQELDRTPRAGSCAAVRCPSVQAYCKFWGCRGATTTNDRSVLNDGLGRTRVGSGCGSIRVGVFTGPVTLCLGAHVEGTGAYVEGRAGLCLCLSLCQLKGTHVCFGASS